MKEFFFQDKKQKSHGIEQTKETVLLVGNINYFMSRCFEDMEDLEIGNIFFDFAGGNIYWLKKANPPKYFFILKNIFKKVNKLRKFK